jgi:hypothetical protein
MAEYSLCPRCGYAGDTTILMCKNDRTLYCTNCGIAMWECPHCRSTDYDMLGDVRNKTPTPNDEDYKQLQRDREERRMNNRCPTCGGWETLQKVFICPTDKIPFCNICATGKTHDLCPICSEKGKHLRSV